MLVCLRLRQSSRRSTAVRLGVRFERHLVVGRWITFLEFLLHLPDGDVGAFRISFNSGCDASLHVRSADLLSGAERAARLFDQFSCCQRDSRCRVHLVHSVAVEQPLRLHLCRSQSGRAESGRHGFPLLTFSLLTVILFSPQLLCRHFCKKKKIHCALSELNR